MTHIAPPIMAGNGVLIWHGMSRTASISRGFRLVSDSLHYRHTQIGTVGGRLAGDTDGEAPEESYALQSVCWKAH